MTDDHPAPGAARYEPCWIHWRVDMRSLALALCAALLLSGLPLSGSQAAPADLDHLLAPIALYPDSLLAQMLMCAEDPVGVKALDQFLKGHATLKGTDLQDAALKDNFQPSF